MKPAFVVLNMFQGQTYRDFLVLSDADTGLPLDLTGKEARMEIRDDMGALKLELSTANGRIAALTNNGRIQFDVDAATLAAIPTMYDYEQWKYDIELFYLEGLVEIVERPVRGVVLFWPEITTGA